MVAAAHAAAHADVTMDQKTVAEDGHRDGKLFSVFQIVKFNNDPCKAVDGTVGTCYTASECTSMGGEERGNCASGFGVCCVNIIDNCNASPTVSMNNSYIQNQGYPGDVSSGASACATSRQTTTAALTAEYTISKAASDIVQFRFDFLTTKVSNPMMGSCDNDTISITGADAVTMKTMPMNLCGVLSGSHIYVSVKDVDSVKLTIKLTSLADQTWNILVSQFDSSQTDYLAPRGCLQYYRQDIGTLETFNYDSGNGELLNDHMYTMCIAQNDAYCDIALTSTSFMLGGSSGACSDAVVFGTNQLCGSTFGTSNQLNWNYTGSYMVPFMSDSDNAAMDGGFSIGYVLLPC